MIVPHEVADADTVGRHYDDLDIYYRDVWGEHLHHGLWRTGDETPEEAVRLLIAVVAQAADVDEGAVVCDIGCGYGGTSRVLASQYRAHVIGYTVGMLQKPVPPLMKVGLGKFRCAAGTEETAEP